jgi:hypothetical protein
MSAQEINVLKAQPPKPYEDLDPPNQPWNCIAHGHATRVTIALMPVLSMRPQLIYSALCVLRRASARNKFSRRAGDWHHQTAVMQLQYLCDQESCCFMSAQKMPD